MSQDKASHDAIVASVRKADLGIQDIIVKELTEQSLPQDIPLQLRRRYIEERTRDGMKSYANTETIHNLYDKEHKVIGTRRFLMDEHESHGTRKYFHLAAPILEALEGGKVLVIDEFDSRLHPHLVLSLFSLFNTPEVNRHGAQLLVTPHNTSLLQNHVVRKDQVWFVEKDRFEASHLFSLADFKSTKVRSAENYESNYRKGKYGATPYTEAWRSWNDLVGEGDD